MPLFRVLCCTETEHGRAPFPCPALLPITRGCLSLLVAHLIISAADLSAAAAHGGGGGGGGRSAEAEAALKAAASRAAEAALSSGNAAANGSSSSSNGNGNGRPSGRQLQALLRMALVSLELSLGHQQIADARMPSEAPM